ncbi:hypothetical protein LMG27198_48570 [Methylocystis echinoides]|uniref:Uncharacterized protein n=1 Tax=Methylocystis echinoides TaxID=29468 RepID=A0A9W6GZU2_9HYPH|nr:hypothetical protein LMG27198_48570 [Methylocystis echinoides]
MANFRDMVQRQLANLRAGVGVSIDEAKKAADFVEAKIKFAAAPHEAQALEMLDHLICCFLTMRRAATELTADSASAEAIRRPDRYRAP